MIFDIFDKDGSGEITFEEFQKATKEIGVHLNREKAEEKFKKADINGIGIGCNSVFYHLSHINILRRRKNKF